MSANDRPPDDPRDESSEAGARQFLTQFFPVIFEKAVLEANAGDRPSIIRHFAHGPLLDYAAIQHLFALAAEVRVVENRIADADVLLNSAKELLSVVVAERAEKVKNGLSIQYVFKGEVIASIGHALNEGVTEWFTSKSMKKLVDRVPELKAEAERHPEVTRDGAYAIEVTLADELISAVGEHAVGRGYFGGAEALQELFKRQGQTFTS